MNDDLTPDQVDDLDGHTLEELSDYLDSGRQPRNEQIEDSPSCQIALASLERLRATTLSVLETEAESAPERETLWIGRVMQSIAREARSGRDIPISDPDPRAILTVTEGAIRGLIRSIGDADGRLIIGRCELAGDVTSPGEPIDVTVTASAVFGENLVALADALRLRIAAALAEQTELVLASVNVTITDIHSTRTPGGAR
ncbi:hypothetical protein BH09ACT6_BH09ACT6_13180 [soil metagenome]